MNDALLKQISTYAEDREIDYISAKVIGEQQGIRWRNEAQLVDFKQTIDMYLKTFDMDKFKLIEMKIETLSGKKARTAEEAEKLTSYASKPRSASKKKAVKEGKESTWTCKSKDGKIKVEESQEGVFDVYKNGRKVDTLRNVTRRQIAQQMRQS